MRKATPDKAPVSNGSEQPANPLKNASEVAQAARDATPAASMAQDPSAKPFTPTEAGPAPEQGDVKQAQPGESDVEFALRVFQVNPKTFINADGSLDRAALETSIDQYRQLYAKRLMHAGV